MRKSFFKIAIAAFISISFSIIAVAGEPTLGYNAADVELVKAFDIKSDPPVIFNAARVAEINTDTQLTHQHKQSVLIALYVRGDNRKPSDEVGWRNYIKA
ncbi:hypothetical protein ACFO4O_04220 [Glaciecola siphonariae]|uniref:Uncharacterized protein n=1 Tax=Glaciecola siphonariae TaxID=521012 RepID=A0ABV9LV94_9ALTE